MIKVSTFYHHRLDQLISKWRRLKINAILVKISKAREDYEEKKLILKVQEPIKLTKECVRNLLQRDPSPKPIHQSQLGGFPKGTIG